MWNKKKFNWHIINIISHGNTVMADLYDVIIDSYIHLQNVHDFAVCYSHVNVKFANVKEILV